MMLPTAAIVLAVGLSASESFALRSSVSDQAAQTPWVPAEGPLNSVFPSTNGRPKLIMGMDVDYPPYAYLRQPPFAQSTALDEVVGVGADMIRGMGKLCGFDVEIMQVHWGDCWGQGEVGQGLLQGWYHGCMTYTHATGVRNRYLEFSNSWAVPNKPSGLITRLVNGVPFIHGSDTLSGRTIVDVTGWAPTADTLYFVKNQCNQKKYEGFTVVQGDDIQVKGRSQGANDRALLAVLEGSADAMWIYGDQASHYVCGEGEVQDGWNCDLWNGFGTTFAYVQSGMYGWMHNGTTVSMSKKGSGLSEFLDPCLDRFMQTREYYEICKQGHGNPPHNQMSVCVPNRYFAEDPEYKPKDIHHQPFLFPTHDMKGQQSCATGYCSCDE